MYKKGDIVKGIVSGIETYGIFVKIDDNYSGLIHISEVSNKFVRDINDFVKIKDVIRVQILEIDDTCNHMNLSIKNIQYKVYNTNKRKKIVETKLGFKTLAYKLPFWIQENLENCKKKS